MAELRSLFLNCTLKRSPHSHTEGLARKVIGWFDTMNDAVRSCASSTTAC